ncbi:MAG: DUF4293 domain-containing protein [Bacteroidales bacterium]
MIQRIQSVYLLVAGIFLVFLLFNPIAEIIRSADEAIFELRFLGLVNEAGETEKLSILPLSILISLCIAITFITIFLFKKRMLQIRLCVINIVLLLGLEGLMFYYVFVAQNELEGDVSYKLLIVFPVVSAILVYLALRATAKDEALVRSLNRLR